MILTHQDILVVVWVLELEVSGSGQHGFDSAHAVIVMELRGQLLRAQAVRRHDLHGQDTSVHEAVRVERDLTDHGVVWYHHSHCAEQDLKEK